MDILINNKIVKFNKEDFPMFINGVDKSGASFFSICLLSSLLKNDYKVLLFSAYPAAKEEFRNQLKDYNDENLLIIESGDENYFIEKLNKIIDLDERIVLFKNIENYSLKLFNKLRDNKFVIFSGDVDKCIFAEQLIKKEFKTKIFFSYSEKFKIENKIDLSKYEGLIISDVYKGVIKLGK